MTRTEGRGEKRPLASPPSSSIDAKAGSDLLGLAGVRVGDGGGGGLALGVDLVCWS